MILEWILKGKGHLCVPGRKVIDHCDPARVSQEQIMSAMPSFTYSTSLPVYARKETCKTGDLHCSKIMDTGKGHLKKSTYKGNQNFVLNSEKDFYWALTQQNKT